MEKGPLCLEDGRNETLEIGTWTCGKFVYKM